MKKTFTLLFLASAFAANTWAQGPNNSGTYYQSADGKKGEALKTALYNILRGKYINNRLFTVVSYAGLFDAYTDTDLREDGKIWDMYSSKTSFLPSQHTGNYKQEGDMYNREHSVPQSWFDDSSNKDSGDSQTKMYSDLFNVYPTDGYVNNRRSNFPYAENNGESFKSDGGFSKVGKSTTAGYNGSSFEPNDMYKGDFARSYFYMVTCYQDKVLNLSTGSSVFYGKTADSNGNSIVYPGLKEWALNMFMNWSNTDGVSDKEVNRNKAVATLQYNRNPFIDYPGLEQYIWGSMRDVAFSYDNYQVPEGTSPYVPQGGDPGDNPSTEPTEGEHVYKLITSAAELESGAGYLLVSEANGMAMSAQGNDIRTNVSLTLSSGTATTRVNESGKPYELTLGTGTADGTTYYTLYDATGKVYLALTSNGNKLYVSDTATSSKERWSITFNGDNAVISPLAYPERSIQYNKTAPRFACYSSSQQAVQLYKRQETTTGMTTAAAAEAKPNTIVYDLQGRRMGTTATGVPQLQKGVYILGGRKVVVK